MPFWNDTEEKKNRYTLQMMNVWFEPETHTQRHIPRKKDLKSENIQRATKTSIAIG